MDSLVNSSKEVQAWKVIFIRIFRMNISLPGIRSWCSLTSCHNSKHSRSYSLREIYDSLCGKCELKATPGSPKALFDSSTHEKESINRFGALTQVPVTERHCGRPPHHASVKPQLSSPMSSRQMTPSQIEHDGLAVAIEILQDLQVSYDVSWALFQS